MRRRSSTAGSLDDPAKVVDLGCDAANGRTNWWRSRTQLVDDPHTVHAGQC